MQLSYTECFLGMGHWWEQLKLCPGPDGSGSKCESCTISGSMTPDLVYLESLVDIGHLN